MNLRTLFFLMIYCILSLPMTAAATELVDRLDKTFKTAGYSETEVVVRITVNTEIREFDGEHPDDNYLQALKVHRKLLSVMIKNGWGQEDQLLVNVIDVWSIGLEPDLGMNLKFKETFRLKAYLSACDGAMEKYRGGSIDQFLQNNVIEKAERCFTYEKRLQGKDYPYQ